MLKRTVIRPHFVIAVLMCSVAPAAVAQFEGVVESRNVTTDETGASQEFVMTMWIKGDMVKIQTSAIGSQPGSTMIYRNDRHVVWIVNDVDKTYSEMRQEDSVADTAGRSDRRGVDTPVIRRTKKTKKILGYLCEKIIVSTPEDETEIWGTKALGRLASSISRVFGTESSEDGDAWTDELSSLGVFPLIASTKVRGEVVESQTVTKIEARTLPEGLFELPSEYKKQHVGDMMK